MDVPSVPITTLAGVASLTDLLPEMSLPTPQPQTMNNKSLLFHPRVAEEAQNYLRAVDGALVPQLLHAVNQTSADHIVVKDCFASADAAPTVDLHGDAPQLLQHLIAADPNVFRSKGDHSVQQLGGAVDAYGMTYPAYAMMQQQQQPPSTEYVDGQQQQQQHLQMNSIGVHEMDALPVYADQMHNMQYADYDPYKQVHQQTQPPAYEQPPPQYEQVPVHNIAPAPAVASTTNTHESVQSADGPVIKQPVVRLPRISVQDQQLMQKSLANFIENRPKLAKELGIDEAEEAAQHAAAMNKRANKSSGVRYKDDSNSDDDDDVDADEPEDEGGGGARKKRTKQARKNNAEDKEDDYVPDTFSALVGKKRRFEPANERAAATAGAPAMKPKMRRVEKAFAPEVRKMTIEELMESNTYGRFNKSVDYVLRFYDNLDPAEMCDDGTVPDEHLLSRHAMQNLVTEAAKLNIQCAMEMIPADRILKLMLVLEMTIRGADCVSPITDEDNENMRQLWVETAMERVMGAADACLVCLHMLTAKNMPKRVYVEDVMDRIVLYIRYQLLHTIFPTYDVTYRLDNNKKKDGRKKKTVPIRDKQIQVLYNKLCQLVSMLADLLEIQLLPDMTVLHMSSMGVAAFFVENVNDLQLSCLKLVTTLFTRYEKHRRLLLEDVLASIARLPSTKRSLRTYKLNADENIQMLTALVLQLMQCIAILPENLNKKVDKQNKYKNTGAKSDAVKNVDRDVLIANKYREAVSTAVVFLSAFLKKCAKNEDIDYRPLFENFVQDLLTALNKPEWPAAETLLNLLGKLLVTNFRKKNVELSLRVASLDYLGVITARLRRDSVHSRCKLSTIDHMIKEIKAEEMRTMDGGEVNPKKLEIKNDEERTQFLQRVLLDFLAVHAQSEDRFARHHYIVDWLHECTKEKAALAEREKTADELNSKQARIDDSDDSDAETSASAATNHTDVEALIEQQRNLDDRKKFLFTRINPAKQTVIEAQRKMIFVTYINYDMAELITQYLSSKRYFSNCFDIYLKSILYVLRETSIALRTKAMKCLTMIVEADPAVLGLRDLQLGVNHSLLDHSTSVREAAVDLIGKFVLSRPELIDKYYSMLLERIRDTGVSVRKRVIKILKDVCVGCPDFPKIPEICLTMLRRVNDEDGIRKLVMEVFQNMWFTTSSGDTLLRKVTNITDVIAASGNNLETFENLLVSMFKPKQDREDTTKVNVEAQKQLSIACKQIVDCLIDNLLLLEGTDGASPRLTACITTLYLFAKIRPQLLVKHASTLQPYLTIKCDISDEPKIIGRVASMLEVVVPLMEHPSDSFLSQLEEDLMKLILQHDRNIVASCMAALAAIINKVTKNYKLVCDCFNKYFKFLEHVYGGMRNGALGGTPQLQPQQRGYFRRSIFTVGLLFRYFDFKSPKIASAISATTKDKIYEMFMYFMQQNDPDMQWITLVAMGSVCIRHCEFMLKDEIKEFYHHQLQATDAPLRNRIEVLKSIETYLVEEEHRMVEQEWEWAERSKNENLKEMGDISAGMASTIIQMYLKVVLHSYSHADTRVRLPALQVIHLVLRQGLVYPVQIMPHLICMSTDPETYISYIADKQLAEFDKRYPGIIYSSSAYGIRLSFELQCVIRPEAIFVRGSRVKTAGEYPSALNGYLYTLLRSSKQQRRALILSILKQFDQSSTSLPYMLYLADNVAYFPYQVQDEVLFIIHHINVILAASGANLLQLFRDGLIMTELQMQSAADATVSSTMDEDDEDEEALIERVPPDVTALQECLKSAQGCLLLLTLKQHLKDIYGVSDGKIQQYSPSDASKVFDKVANRKTSALFNPEATLAKINEGTPPNHLDYNGRKNLIRQYLDFKRLMLLLDPEDEDEDEGNKASVANANHNSVATSSLLTEADQAVLTNYKDNIPPKVPKLVISNRRMDEPKKRSPRKTTTTTTTEKPRQNRPKKKWRKIVVSSGEESDNSDPDYVG